MRYRRIDMLALVDNSLSPMINSEDERFSTVTPQSGVQRRKAKSKADLLGFTAPLSPSLEPQGTSELVERLFVIDCELLTWWAPVGEQ